jgi:hypothetical protein
MNEYEGGEVMVHRGIATVALAIVTCFLLLSHFDPRFFFLHFYESLIYIVIVLLLFYSEERWAYMLGIVAPTAWLLLTFATGGFGAFTRLIWSIIYGDAPSYTAFFLGGIITILSVAMIVVCTYRWKREFAGLREGLSTFFVSAGIVAAYYTVLAIWFWRSAAVRLHS